jgi:tetratricopeptide (TPR) repeat protein
MMFRLINEKITRPPRLAGGLVAAVIGGCFIVHAAAADSYAQRRATPQIAQPGATPASHPGAVAEKGEAALALQTAAEFLQAGRLAEAESLLVRIVADTPRDAQARVLLGVVFDKQGHPEEAEREYREAIRLEPLNVSALANMGVLLARTNRLAQAIETFESLLRIAPNHVQAAYNLAVIYASREDYKRAIPLLERAAGVRSETLASSNAADSSLLVMLAKAYLHEGRTKEAARLTVEIERAAGNDPRMLFSLALELAGAHEYEQAIRLFRRTNELRPNTFEVLYNLGVALYNVDRLDEAAQALETASSVRSNDPDTFYRRGLVASARKQSETAIDLFLKALELKPQFAEANFMIAEELFKHERFETSLPFYQRAVEQDPTRLVYYIRYGAAHFRRIRYEQARAI